MADHITEEQQLEELKTWWNEYWMTIVVPIVVVALGYFGWSMWQSHQTKNAESASLVYDRLVKSLGTGPDVPADKQAQVKKNAEEVINDFDSTIYADRSHLILAKLAVENGAMAEAETHLEKVVDSGVSDAIKNVAKSRLARLKVAQKDYTGALALVEETNSKDFKAVFAEIRGDVLAAQGETEAAKTAYQEALDNLGQEFARKGIIDLKMQGVGMIADVAQEKMAPPAPTKKTAKPEAVETQAPKANKEGEGNS